jgi:septum formation protein
LASASPARRELLQRAGYRFEVMPSHIQEPEAKAADPRAFVQEVAWLKAAGVAPKVDSGIVLAADTVAWLNGEIIGKPTDVGDARRILRTLGGTDHELWSGVCLWRRPDDLQLAFQEKTIVRFQALADDEISAYLATRQWEGCSGAYAIEESNDPYLQIVSGSLSNVIGLPMESLASGLAEFAARPGL